MIWGRERSSVFVHLLPSSLSLFPPFFEIMYYLSAPLSLSQSSVSLSLFVSIAGCTHSKTDLPRGDPTLIPRRDIGETCGKTIAVIVYCCSNTYEFRLQAIVLITVVASLFCSYLLYVCDVRHINVLSQAARSSVELLLAPSWAWGWASSWAPWAGTRLLSKSSRERR
jgi:hypothetical protein